MKHYFAKAQLALQQAKQRAAAVAVEDPIMGMLQAAEVRRLRATLSIVVPGFAATGATPDQMQ